MKIQIDIGRVFIAIGALIVCLYLFNSIFRSETKSFNGVVVDVSCKERMHGYDFDMSLALDNGESKSFSIGSISCGRLSVVEVGRTVSLKQRVFNNGVEELIVDEYPVFTERESFINALLGLILILSLFFGIGIASIKNARTREAEKLT
ncbi:hypothetical protein HCU74_01715 [Spongiibacter sp. KMU-166]|uniref:DUF3592 domain-containing protein n=1 Tax=Spongiibacter thalassae TaxID=2721624 RepID=A0ABX1GB31_9GAMM|nr:hypothetical protein [Spongiibacter thalassae]NKI16126.1 hypothetical protein [Spongiibacter thalassae]